MTKLNSITAAFGYLRHYFSVFIFHDIHSSFVHQLAEKTHNDANPNPDIQTIELLRSELSRNSSAIDMIDYGGGSHDHPRGSTVPLQPVQYKRKIKDLVRAAIKPRQGRLLYKLVQHFQPEIVLELGTSLGISTACLAAGNKAATVYTIEGDPASAGIAAQNCHHLKLNNIIQHIGSFDEILPEILHKTGKIDFVFIDGNHRHEALLKYFHLCLAKSHPGTVYVFDDIRWSEGMLKAWEEIRNHERVSVTLDFFFFGIAFLIQNTAKQHYKLVL